MAIYNLKGEIVPAYENVSLITDALFKSPDSTFPLEFEGGTYNQISVGSTLDKYYGGGYDKTRKVIKTTVFNASVNVELKCKTGYSMTVFTSVNGVITGSSGLVTSATLVGGNQYGMTLRTTGGTDDISEIPVSDIVEIKYIDVATEALENNVNPLGLHTMPDSIGALNVVKRCRQMTDIKWTPAVDLPRLMMVQRSYPIPSSATAEEYEGTFKEGVEYTGIPYGRCNTQMNAYGYEYSYVGSDIDLDTFITSVMNPKSKLCVESQFNLSNHETTIYGAVCSALTCYALDVPYVPTAQIPNISGLTLIGKINNNGTHLDDSNFKLGDVFNLTGYHTAMVTDIIKDDEGNVQIIELSDASTAGLADKGYADGQIGGICRRKGWTIEQIYDSWGDYSLYRYANIQSVTYTPSRYVNIGGEPDMMRIEHYPVMPYEGENFKFKTGNIPNNAVKLVINLTGYSYLRVFKGDTEISGSPFSVANAESINISTISTGNYSAYLCNMSGNNVTNLSAKCHWSIE